LSLRKSEGQLLLRSSLVIKEEEGGEQVTRRNIEMPKQVKARAAQYQQEERKVRKLAGSHHAPADWKFHAQMVLLSWDGKTPNEIAYELGCHPQTVRIHLKRFTLEGIAGLGMRPGSGRK
jgi:DNA-binding NarL/FixJ family response regulator